MRVLPKLVVCAIPMLVGISACEKKPVPPPPPRTIAISVSSAAAPVKDLTGQVVIVPYEKGREKLFEAMLKRRKTEETLRKEEAELEKLLPNSIGEIAQPPQAPDQELDRLVGAARRTIESLADFALLYYEKVAEAKGKELPPERLAAFREKLGVDELKRSSRTIKGNDPESTRAAIATVQDVLKREVYSAEDFKTERSRTENVLKQLDAEISKAPSSKRPPAGAGAVASSRPPSGSDVYLRYMNNRATHHQTTDPLAAFTALPKAEIRSTTDNDGKCTVQIPPTGRWIIGIAFQRPGEDILSRNFGLSESFCWIEEIPADRNSLTFNQDNILKRSVAPLGLEQSTPWR